VAIFRIWSYRNNAYSTFQTNATERMRIDSSGNCLLVNDPARTASLISTLTEFQHEKRGMRLA
jgi:hypothetical protein